MNDHPITFETIFVDLLGYDELPNPNFPERGTRFSPLFVLEIAQLAYDKGKQEGRLEAT